MWPDSALTEVFWHRELIFVRLLCVSALTQKWQKGGPTMTQSLALGSALPVGLRAASSPGLLH